MTANELRIGNLVMFTGLAGEEIVEITARWFTSLAGGRPFNEIKNDEKINGYWKPIPLTKEWFIKFGFKMDDGYLVKDANFHSSVIELAQSNYEDCVLLINGEYSNIRHVHQLQNLYFALTGLELHTGG